MERSCKNPPVAHKWLRDAFGARTRTMAMALREENLEGASGGGKTITEAQAEDAFRTILKWVGEDANRDGLIETPHRIVCAYCEYFAGYDEEPHEVLRNTFRE